MSCYEERFIEAEKALSQEAKAEMAEAIKDFAWWADATDAEYMALELCRMATRLRIEKAERDIREIAARGVNVEIVPKR